MKHNHNFCVYFSSRPFAISQKFYASSIFKMSIHKIMRTANIIRRNHEQHKTNVRSFHWNLSRNRILFEIGVAFVHLIYTCAIKMNCILRHVQKTIRQLCECKLIKCDGKSKTLPLFCFHLVLALVSNICCVQLSLFIFSFVPRFFLFWPKKK